MEFGTNYKDIEEVVAILEQHLGIAMTKDDDSETGVSYGWSTAPDEHGVSYYGIDVEPTRVFDEEEKRVRLRHRDWKPYTFVIGVSDELDSYNARIRHLIEQRLLIAKEIPFRPVV